MNDYCVYMAQEPFGGIMLHLDTALGGQPAFVAEYWTGAWTALTLTSTPDFTQALGYPNQRAQWTFFPGLSPAWVAAAQGSGGVVGYAMRLRRTAADAFGAPVANTAYKDYLYGHFKSWFSNYDLKRGDDGAGSSPTTFEDPGPFHIRFRHGFAHDGARGNQAQPVSFGSKTTQTKRQSPRFPWAIQQNTKKNMRNYSMYGGALLGIGDIGGALGFLKSSSTCEIVSCLVSGFHNMNYGGTGAGAMDFIEDVSLVAHPRAASTSRLANIISAGFARGMALHSNQDDPAGAVGLVRISSDGTAWGLKLNDDRFDAAPLVGQIYKSNAGQVFLPDIQWGGPAIKIARSSVVGGGNPSAVIEPRRLPILIHVDGTNEPPPAGIPVRITGADGVVQTLSNAALDANGQCFFDNALGEPSGDAVLGQNWVWASVWRSVEGLGDPIEELLDDPLKVEINPPDMAGYNSDYVTVTIFMRFPRADWFDWSDGTWKRPEWQRTDGALMLGLRRASIDAITSGEIPLPESSELRYEGVVPETT